MYLVMEYVDEYGNLQKKIEGIDDDDEVIEKDYDSNNEDEEQLNSSS